MRRAGRGSAAHVDGREKGAQPTGPRRSHQHPEPPLPPTGGDPSLLQELSVIVCDVLVLFIGRVSCGFPFLSIFRI